MPDVFVYKQTHDHNFAPHVSRGRLTLACCKPRIRRVARVGDWVVGIAANTNRFGAEPGAIVSAFRVDEKLTFSDYWEDSRAKGRIDRIYDPKGAPKGEGKIHHPRKDQQEGDRRGLHVLVSKKYRYFPHAQPCVMEPGLIPRLRGVRDYRRLPRDSIKETLERIHAYPQPTVLQHAEIACCPPGTAKRGCGC